MDRTASADSALSDDTLQDAQYSPQDYWLKKGFSAESPTDLRSPTSEDDKPPQAEHPTEHRPEKIWIPAKHDNRTLVLCFDGTGDHFDSDNSNVVQLVSMLRKDDTTQQLVYYQPGIGTYSGVNLPVISTISKSMDEMFATSLSTHIKQGYEFLMQNYTQGDKICLFGFSRGAYTARALAGMLQKVGLLPLSNHAQLPFAYDMYAHMATDPSDAAAFRDEAILVETFKRTFCREVHVEFLGVWDTVASVGLIPRYLPFISNNNGVRHLRHALALDERRVKFLPSFVQGGKNGADMDVSPGPVVQDKPEHDDKPGMDAPGADSDHAGAEKAKTGGNDAHNGKRKPNKRQQSAQKRFEDFVNAREPPCDALEVWFTGVHADVGGGSVRNAAPHALARIPLRWMVREAFRCGAGIVFDAAMLQQIGLSLDVSPAGAVRGLAPPPPRVRPQDAPGVLAEMEDEEHDDGGFWRGVLGVLGVVFGPVVWVLQVLWMLLTGGRSARRGWLSDSARGRGRTIIPSRMHPDHVPGAEGPQNDGAQNAAAQEDGKQNDGSQNDDEQKARARHPHALDLARCAAQDPTYEAREELKDALSPLYDQLGGASGATRLMWLAMEYMPMRLRKEGAIRRAEAGGRGWHWVQNRGRGRVIPTHELHEGLKVHRSVKTRLEARGAARAHPASRAREDTHVRLRLAGEGAAPGADGEAEGVEVYVPQVRPHLEEGGKKVKARRWGYEEWNVERPEVWEWVD